MFLSACGSFRRPHLKVTPPDHNSYITLKMAMKYANDWKQEYRDALNDQTAFTNWLGASLIPLGGATLGLAITGAPTLATTIVGLTGATAYGVGAWFENKPQLLAYAEGYRAIGCAQAAFAPLLVLDTPSSICKTWTLADKLKQYIEQMNTEIGKCAGSTEEPEVATIISTGLAAIRSGESLLGMHYSAGSQLVLATDSIVGDIDKLIISSQPGLAGVQASISGVADFYSQLTTVPTSEAGTAKKANGCDIPYISQLSNGIASIVNRVGAIKPLEALRACQVQVDTLPSNLQLDPEPPYKATKERPYIPILIRGGRAPYSVEVFPKENITIERMGLTSGAFVINTSKATESTYSLIITDSLGKSAVAELNVTLPSQP